VDWSTRLYLYPVGQMTTSAYFLWVLQGRAGPIVIDTGFTHRQARLKGVPTDSMRTREALLASVDIDPDSVRCVILTHMHWDHFDLEGAYPQATFWVQRREVEFWTDVAGGDPWFERWISDSFGDDLQVLRAEDRLRIVDGVHEPFPGVRLELVGGHSPGMQIVVVETVGGPFVLANDALTTYRNLREWMPPAYHLCSIQECLDAMRRIRELTGGDERRLCPGHDAEVWQRFPEVRPGVYRLA
jgi:glyoxylase-like metal-dependent hydrolase (beta-lactamase superfamily II)